MEDDIYCGSLCVKYILDHLKIKHNLNKKMIWSSELALFLNKNLDNKVTLNYYKSNLVRDYKKQKNRKIEGIKQLDCYINNNGILNSKKLNCLRLKREINNNMFVILCVESKKFNNDSSLTGGHFIVLNNVSGKYVNIINPKKNYCVSEQIKLKKLISCTKNYGSWRVLIK